MVKGRSTTIVHIRVPDALIAQFRAKAARKGIPYTVFIRQLIQKELGLPPG